VNPGARCNSMLQLPRLLCGRLAVLSLVLSSSAVFAATPVYPAAEPAIKLAPDDAAFHQRSSDWPLRETHTLTQSIIRSVQEKKKLLRGRLLREMRTSTWPWNTPLAFIATWFPSTTWTCSASSTPTSSPRAFLAAVSFLAVSSLVHISANGLSPLAAGMPFWRAVKMPIMVALRTSVASCP